MNNLLKRSLTGILFCAVIVASLLFYKPLFPAVVIISLYMMMKEFYVISLGGEYTIESRLFILSGFLMFAAAYFISSSNCEDFKLMLFSVIPIAAAMIILMCRKNIQETYYKVPYLFMGFLYIGIPTALTPLIVFRDGIFDGMLMMDFFLVIWASDIGAYCVGSALGQKEGSKKLAPKISPKKSWWGVVGGLVFSVAVGIVLYAAGWLEMSLVHAIALSLVLCAGGICGDLFESLFKRFFHVKDSGNAIPGHGGFLDRFDSSLFAMPLATVYLSIFNLL